MDERNHKKREISEHVRKRKMKMAMYVMFKEAEHFKIDRQ